MSRRIAVQETDGNEYVREDSLDVKGGENSLNIQEGSSGVKEGSSGSMNNEEESLNTEKVFISKVPNGRLFSYMFQFFSSPFLSIRIYLSIHLFIYLSIYSYIDIFISKILIPSENWDEKIFCSHHLFIFKCINMFAYFLFNWDKHIYLFINSCINFLILLI